MNLLLLMNKLYHLWIRLYFSFFFSCYLEFHFLVILFNRGTRVKKLYSWHNYRLRSLIFPIVWSGFFLPCLMLKFPGKFNSLGTLVWFHHLAIFHVYHGIVDCSMPEYLNWCHMIAKMQGTLMLK